MTEHKVPYSIGFILDGNRRWARERGLPTLEGHRRGMERVRDILYWAKDAGVREIVVYAFSTENWNRAPEEIEHLFKLFEEMCGDAWIEEVKKQDAYFRFIGERERFSPEFQERMRIAEERTKDGTLALVVALSYGGRAEILAAVNKLLAEGAKDVDEATFKEAMWSAGLADPDIIIRTGGEKRLSGFLTWESVYSELFFTDTKLPAFEKEEFDAILAEYAERERRHGK